MTGRNLAVEWSSDETGELNDSKYGRSIARLKLLLYAEVGAKTLQNENQLKRLQNLRKELNYIKDTEWQYEPIEKQIGQS